MTFTKERLLKIKTWRETYGPDSNVVLPAEEAEALAQIALAALEFRADAEPVARDAIRYRFLRDKDAFGEDNAPGLASWDDLAELDTGDFDSAVDARIKASDVPLYTRPQPAPVAVDFKKLARELVENLVDCNGADDSAVKQYQKWAEKTCRAAMLQGKAEPVSQPYTLREWIPCNERLPESGGNYWGWWNESKRQGPVWFIKSDLQAQFQSSEITHWMPLPAAPKQEAQEVKK